jgi:hypothetical protein
MKLPMKKTMSFTRIATSAWMFFALLGFSACSSAETVGLYFESITPQIVFAAGDIKAALEKQKHTVQTHELAALAKAGLGKKIILAIAADKAAVSQLTAQGGKPIPSLGEQAYALRTTTKPDMSYWVLGGDATGAMYGGLQIAENISVQGFSGSYDTEESPFMLYRGMKLNLPMDKRIPTYVGGWSSHSAKEAIPHVWDMTFWKKLIDQQARNRYNLLSVWTHHAFPALVRLPDYPQACLPRIEGFDGYVKEMDHDQRVAFWREVMQYAHSRGMKFYFFNWNVFVDYAKDQYPELTRDMSNTNTIRYMNQCMKALIETYPDLDGFGITAGDGMSHSSEENTKWTYNAIGRAVKEYLADNPARRFNLIHRSVYSNPELFEANFGPLGSPPNLQMDFSFKYAQAHMYSTPTPKWGNAIKSAESLGIKTWLTIRNDDYFYINWGDPGFVRAYMAGIPEKQNVTTMYIGSDGYNPTRTYFSKNDALNGQLEVERRWYMEMLWGRISYNPQVSDDVFRNMLAVRFPTVSAENLFQAWTLASRPLPKVTELVMKDWSLDFHWYPEACWSDPSRCSGFRTIDDVAGPKGGFAGQDVAKGSELCNIADSAAGKCNGKKSSYEVADEMQADARKALSLINTMKAGGNADLEVAINNIKQMAYLSSYYAHKIRGATFKKAKKTELAREQMAKAYCWWMSYSRSMESSYHTDSFRNLSINPSWKFGDAAVLKEYTDLGGEGIPDCKGTQ